MRPRAAALALVLACAPGCVSEEVQKSARDVVTLRSGTVSALRACRGKGPFRTYDVPPEEMLDAVREAVGRARGASGHPIFPLVSPRYGEVVAKERASDASPDPSYDDDWRSAVVVTVHRVPGAPGASRVEIHAMRRSMLLPYVVEWERDLPGWIDEALAQRKDPRSPFRVRGPDEETTAVDPRWPDPSPATGPVNPSGRGAR